METQFPKMTFDCPKAAELKKLLRRHNDKRICVVGTSCTGKTTLLSSIPEARDMDSLIFPLLSPEETAYVCQIPWTEEIGKTMDRLTKERIKIEPGNPVFGTVLLDCDLVIHLTISDKLLKERSEKRSMSLENSRNMEEAILRDVRESEAAKAEFFLG